MRLKIKWVNYISMLALNIMGVCLCLNYSVLGASEEKTETIKIMAHEFNLQGRKNRLVANRNVSIYYQDILITGVQVSYEQEQSQVKVWGDVEITWQSMIMNADSILFSPKENYIICEGNIVFMYEPYRGKSKKSYIDLEKRVVLLSDSPRLWRGQDSLKAERIQIDMRLKKVQLLGKIDVQVMEAN